MIKKKPEQRKKLEEIRKRISIQKFLKEDKPTGTTQVTKKE